MAFDPSSVDLKFVEPGLRAEVLRRIIVIEEYLRTPGSAAGRIARAKLGIRRDQLHILTRAWTARRRAEDVTLRHTRRAYMPRLSPQLAAIVADAVEAGPQDAIKTIIARAGTLATERGERLPSKPTMSRHIIAELRRIGLGHLPHDIVIDVVVIDMPVIDGTWSVRPHVTTVIDTSATSPIGLAVEVEAPDARSVARALMDGFSVETEDGGAGAENFRPISIALPNFGTLQGDMLSVALRRAGCIVQDVTITERGFGKAANILFAGKIADYTIRTQLTLLPAEQRIVADTRVRAVRIAEAEDFIRNRIGMEYTDRRGLAARIAVDKRARLLADLEEIAQA